MDPNDHSLQNHIDKLDRLCRICGGRSIPGKNPKKSVMKCQKNSKKIDTAYGIDVCKDTVGVHSTSLCNKCYARMNALVAAGKNASEKTLQSAKDDVSRTCDLWVPYDASVSVSECRVCDMYIRQAKGGRPLKPQSHTLSHSSSTSMTSQDTEERVDPELDVCSITPTCSPMVKRPTTGNCSATKSKTAKQSKKATKGKTVKQSKKSTESKTATQSGISNQTIRTHKEIALPFTKAEKDLHLQKW